MSIRLLPDGTLEFSNPTDLVAYQAALAPAANGSALEATTPQRREIETHWVTKPESLVMDVLREANGETLTSEEVAELLGWKHSKAGYHLNALIKGGGKRPALVETVGSIHNYRATALGQTAKLLICAQPARAY